MVKIHDPIVKMGPPHQFQSIEETVSGADAVVMCTDWDDYKVLDWASLKSIMSQPYIFDGRNMLDKKKVEGLGFHYLGVSNH